MALATNTTAGEIQLAGDLAGNNDATAPALSSTGVTPGQYTFAQLTIDAKGRVTASSSGDPSIISALLPIATDTTAGVFCVGDGLAVNAGSPTAGYQEIDFSTTLAGGDPTGLDSCAYYRMDVQVDFGATQSISIQGSNLTTIQDVVDELTAAINGATVTFSGDKIKIQSDTTGRTSAVIIILNQFFQCMTNYTSDLGPVYGTDTGCLYAVTATDTTLGVVKIGSGINVTNGIISVDAGTVTPPIATTTTLGTVIVPTSGNIDIDGSGNISVPLATNSTVGIVEVPGGDGLAVDGSGNLTFTYTPATTTTIGGVIVPAAGNIDVDGSGNISVPLATTSTVGVVSIGTGLNIDGSGEVTVDTIPIATTTTLGTVIVPTSGNIDIDGSGNISVPDATSGSKGVVQVGSNIDVAAGVISVPIATNSTLGVVKAGTNVNIDGSGNLSVVNAIATTTTLGEVIVPAAGNIDIDGSGNISVPLSTGSVFGVVKPGNHMTVTAGVLDVDKAVSNTTYGVVKSADTNNITISAGDINVGTNVGKLDTNQTWSGVQSFSTVTLTDAANISTDASLSNNFKVTLAGNRTLDNPTNLVAGTVYTWEIIQDAIGSRTLVYGTKFKFKNGFSSSLTGTANKKEYLTCVCDGTDLFCALTGEYV